MGINRRQFCTLLSASLITPQLLANQHRFLFASAAQNAEGSYELILVDESGKARWRHPLPARAHHVEHHPQESLLAVVGRRPETYIDIVDYQAQKLLTRISSQSGQHFYGHAVFSPDGRYLISTENDIATGQGLIVLRDRYRNYAVTARYSSGGIGPHELKFMPDNRTLVVANGGILTHPDQGRKKLNLDTMEPSLTYIDITTGDILSQAFMPEAFHQLSIRHIDISQAGRLVVALQYQGAPYENPPLVAFHSQGNPIELVRAPDPINIAMKQYCGSARFDSSGQVAAISAPRGNLITFWDQSKGDYLAKIRIRDGCGIAKTHTVGEFLVTSGNGHCYRYNLNTAHKEKLKIKVGTNPAWDNHLTSI